MKTEELIEALGGLDETYIEESENKIEKLKYKRANRFLKPLAACICLVLLASFIRPLLITKINTMVGDSIVSCNPEYPVEGEESLDGNMEEKEGAFSSNDVDESSDAEEAVEKKVNLHGSIYCMASESDLAMYGLDVESLEEEPSKYQGEYLGMIESCEDGTSDTFYDENSIITSEADWVGAELYTYATEKELLLLFQNGKGIVLVKTENHP